MCTGAGWDMIRDPERTHGLHEYVRGSREQRPAGLSDDRTGLLPGP
jgi:hypothetical protein